MNHPAPAKPMVTDVFVKGAVQGWNICVTSTIPNVLMAFVIIKILNHSGLLALIGQIFSPIMGIFGLPAKQPPCCSAAGCRWAAAWASP